jgi:NAD(P)-dependent dehydrogenase (short-subunit alcohol dehydrogenase family)
LKTALVTGASTGIGEACALRLARSGWRVLSGVRRAGDAPQGTEEVLLDVTDAAQIKAAAHGIEELHGLVNNAGIALAAPLEFAPLEELRRQLEVNVLAQVAVTQALLPALRKAKGRIVFMGSIAGKSALPFLGPYSASKHALEAIADALRLELSPWGIGVTIVEPGTIKTPIWTRSAARADELLAAMEGRERLEELYGERIGRFRRIALARGEAGAPADAVAKVVEEALTAARPPTRRLVGRDARIRAAFELLPDRLRDRVYKRVLLAND